MEETLKNNHSSCFRQFACGVGHVINDVTRRLLSSTALVFLMKVVNMSAANSGWIILYTRLIGALVFRPLVGFLCDRVYIPVLSRKLGKRKSWHLIGSAVTVIFVPLLYTTCFVCGDDPRQWKMVLYYCTITTFVMFAICCIEIAHLSLVSVVAKDQKEAVKLNAMRTAFMFLTGILCYLVVLGILGQDNHDQLTSESAMNFTVIALILTSIGLVFVVIFQIGTEESEQPQGEKMLPTTDVLRSRAPDTTSTKNSTGSRVLALSTFSNESTSNLQETRTKDISLGCSLVNETLFAQSEDNTSTKITTAMLPGRLSRHQIEVIVTNMGKREHQVVVVKPFVRRLLDPESSCPLIEGQKKVRDWLKDPHLYQVAFVYTCTKVLQDISYYYLPLFLIDTLKFKKEAIAYLPLAVLFSAAISTGLTKKLAEKTGSKASFIFASLVVIGAAALFYIIPQCPDVLIYPAAVLLGFGFSSMSVNALNFSNELIGNNKNTSGFVFSFLGTTASLAGGSAIIIIQSFFPDESSLSDECNDCGDYVHHVFSLVPGSLAVLSLLMVLLPQDSQNIRHANRSISPHPCSFHHRQVVQGPVFHVMVFLIWHEA
ncbi:major facilitator superfamily domain-containing protein 12-like isoform X1 [Montipora foliosa]|uniref:major facilitator superfamily domain-containing protein 12-like isoform X1 n=1 Tax=Montipora foliosa TaxID=591990 RepID=UPI0035F194ED